MYELATQEKATSGSEPKVAMGDEHTGGGIIVYNTIPRTRPPCQEPRFDANLSRQIDHAVARADVAHLGACDAWALCRHAAGEAVRLADLRDATLAEVIRLEAEMPTEGTDDERQDN